MGDLYDRSRIPDRKPGQRRAAVRAVASRSHDAADCAVLLAVLGLEPAEGKINKGDSGMTNIIETFEGREFRKATASSNGGGCVYLPTDGRADAVADSKSGVVLHVPAGGLLALARGEAE